MCETFYLRREDRLLNSSTSRGNQIKWYHGGFFIKADIMGYESISEALVSDFLGYIRDIDYVDYRFCKIVAGGIKYFGCYSKNMLRDDEYLISMHRLFERAYGKEETNKLLRKYSGKDLVSFVVDTVGNIAGLDITDYLRTLVYLDAITLNEDRHFSNISFIRNASGGTKVALIYDNALSLLSDTTDYLVSDKIVHLRKKVKAKPFSKDFMKQCGYFDKKLLQIDMKGFLESLEYKCVPFKEDNFKRACNLLIANCRLTEGILWEQI